MQQLQLKQEGKRTLSIAAFGADHKKIQVCPLVNIGIHSREHSTILLTLHVVPTICEPLSYQPVTASVEVNSHLVGLDLADFSESSSCLPVDLLVGCDHYWDLVTGSICHGEKGPTAVHTKLGWVLSGPAVSTSAMLCSTTCVTSTHTLSVVSQATESSLLVEQLKAFWELETLGIQEEERSLYDEFVTNITFQDGRYKVMLPWKEYHNILPDNYRLSLRRLKGLLRRLKQDGLLQEYHRVIQGYLEERIIEPVPKEDSTNPIHYLPHHCVVPRDKETTKLRVVFLCVLKFSLVITE